MQAIKSFCARAGTPVTFFVLASLIASFLLSWLGLQAFFMSLALRSGSGFNPITIFTYPWASSGNGSGLIFLLLGWLFFWQVGQQVERDLGVQKFAAVFAGLILMGGLAVWAGSFVSPVGTILFGSFVPVAALAVIWATRHAEQQVQFFMFPIQAKWIGWLSAAMVLFSLGPIIGAFAVLPCVFGYFFAANKIPGLAYVGRVAGKSRKEKVQESKKFNAFMDSVKKKEQEREEKEKLRQLFERSLIEDPDEGKRDTL